MNVNDAIEKIDVIKETIDDAQIHYEGMYSICFLLSGMYVVQFILVIMGVVFAGFPMSLLYVIYAIVEGIVIWQYLLIRIKGKKYSNKYYLGLLSACGFIAIAVPIIVRVVSVIGKNFFNESYEMISASVVYAILEFSKVLLFSFFMIICSYILKKSYLRILPIFVLSAYFFLYFCFFDKGISFPFVLNQEQMGIGYITIYTVVVVYFGYFIMGIYLRSREGKEKRNEYK